MQTLAGKAEFAFARGWQRKPARQLPSMDAALDDVFIDEISFPATDGYALTGTLFLPRGTKRHAVLINSATAVPRKIYRGFASSRPSRLRGPDLRLSRHRRLPAAGDGRLQPAEI